MANNLLTISMITREAIMLFVNSNQFIRNIDRQYDSEFGKNNAKIGSQLRIRLPNDYTVRHGPAISLQDTSEQQTVLTMATQDGVDVNFTTADLYLSLDDFSERILLPMMNNLAGGVASTIMQNSADAICNLKGNFAGDGSILLPNSQTYLRAQAALSINSAPMVNQKIINDPRTEADVVQSLSGLLNPSTAISDQYYEGVMYNALGAKWFSDQTVLAHTTGTCVAGAVAGADQTGPAITLAAIAGTFNVGDIVTIAGVNAVNRVTKKDTGELRQFVVTVEMLNGDTVLNVYPSLIPGVADGNGVIQPVQYQTVTVSPDNNAAVTPVIAPDTQYLKNFRYSPQMVTMATGDLPMPANKVTARHKYDNVSMRSVTDYLIGTDQEVTRLDVLFGSLMVRGEWGVVVPSPAPE
jgi:hypothetical protein